MPPVTKKISMRWYAILIVKLSSIVQNQPKETKLPRRSYFALPPAAAATPVHRVSLFQQPSQTPVATIDLFSDQLPTAKDAD